MTRAYRDLRRAGCDDLSAFRAAVTVLALRHGGLAKAEYEQTVAAWLEEP